MTLGGLTRMGKTVFLKNVVTSLITAQADYTHLFIIDLKRWVRVRTIPKHKTG